MKKFGKISSLRKISYTFHKKWWLTALLLVLSFPLSQKVASITTQKKSETKELFEEIVNCTLSEIDLIDYIIEKDLITTSTIDQLISTEDKRLIDSLWIWEWITAVALYNEQFRDNWIKYEQEFIAVLDTLWVPKEVAPRFHRALSDKMYHSTKNNTIPTILPKDYNHIINMIWSTNNALACDFFEQGNISLSKPKTITKHRFSPETKTDTTNTLQVFKQNNIHLRSSQLHHKEDWNSYEHWRTCIVGIKDYVRWFLQALSQQLWEVWVTWWTERWHMWERYCVAGQIQWKGRSTKLHWGWNVIDIWLDGVSSLLLFEYFPNQSGNFSFLWYSWTYSRHAHWGEKNTASSFKKQPEKVSPSMHLHIYIASWPTSSSHSSPSDTIPTHPQHHEVLEVPSI